MSKCEIRKVVFCNSSSWATSKIMVHFTADDIVLFSGSLMAQLNQIPHEITSKDGTFLADAFASRVHGVDHLGYTLDANAQ